MDLISDEIKREIFKDVLKSVLLYYFITYTLMKYPEKKLDENNTQLLCAFLNKLYDHLPPISQTKQVRHAEK